MSVALDDASTKMTMRTNRAWLVASFAVFTCASTAACIGGPADESATKTIDVNATSDDDDAKDKSDKKTKPKPSPSDNVPATPLPPSERPDEHPKDPRSEETCASLAALPPAGFFTHEGLPLIGGDKKIIDVSVTEFAHEWDVGNGKQFQRTLSVTFSTAANACAYRRIGGAFADEHHVSIATTKTSTGEAPAQFGLGTFAVSGGEGGFQECTSDKEIGGGAVANDIRGTITITHRYEDIVEGSYEVKSAGSDTVLYKGTFIAPICAQTPSAPSVCCK